MSMTVDRLIRELQKHPKDAVVGIQDHDAGWDEISAYVRDVEPFDPSTITKEYKDNWGKNVGVVIRAGS